MKQIREKLDQISALEKAEEATKIPKEYLVFVGGITFFVLVFFGIGAGSLCSIVGFVYPAFKSLEAIESKIRGDDTQWLIYWVCYSFFCVIESFVDYLLHWIPFYFAFKLAFLLWAMLPQTKGAKFLYDSFLKEFLKKNESKIDAALNDAKRSASTIASEVAAATAELSSAGISTAAQYAQRNSQDDSQDSNETDAKKDS